MNIGYLGFGAMGSAMAEGFAKFAPAIQRGEITQYAYAPHADKLQKRASEIGVLPCASAEELAAKCDMIVLACKPYQAEQVLRALDLRGKALVSLANTWTHDRLKAVLGDGVRVQYIMPNIPMKIGKGTVLLAAENDLTAEERQTLRALLESVSAVIELPEDKIPAANALTGCGPAFLYMVIEALGDAGVKHGLGRRAAYELAAAAMVGAGEMVLRDPDAHPGALKDAVCSPAGITIRGVAALEESGMRGDFIRAVDAVLA